MRKLLSVLFAVFSMVGGFCYQIYNISATLSGANEVPPVITMGSGTLTGTYNSATGDATLNLNTSNLSGAPVAAHIHAGAAGVNGAVIVPLNIVSNPFVINIPLANRTDFLSGNTYANVHTSTFPAGEIRGQVIASLVVVPTLTTWFIFALMLAISILGVIYFRNGVLARDNIR